MPDGGRDQNGGGGKGGAPDQALLEALLTHTPYGVYLIDLGGRILAANQRGAEHLGRTPQQLVGTLLKEYFPPELGESRGRRGVEAIESGRAVTFEERVGDRCFLATIVPIFEAGAPTHFAIYGVDVTEQKRVQASLEESQRLYRLVIEHASDVVWVFDPLQLKFRYVSPSIERLLGYTVQEAMGLTLDRLIVGGIEQVAGLIPGMEAVLDGQQAFANAWQEMQHLRKDGSTVWVEVAATVVRREDGQIELIGATREITQRKRAHALLQAQRDLAVAVAASPGLEQTLQLCFDAAMGAAEMDCGGVYLVDPASGDLDLAHHHGLPADFVAAVEHYPADSPNARRVSVGDHVYSLQVPDERLRREGLRCLSVLPVAHEGRVIGCFNLASHTRDEISEAHRAAVEAIVAQAAAAIVRSREVARARRLEAQLQLAQRMEAIGVLAGGIAHDFNNLLTGIVGNASLLLADVPPDHPHRARLQAIEECVRSGAELTGQLLGFARRGKYEVKPTQLNRLIEQASKMFGRTRKEVTIHHRLAADLWVTEVDRSQIEQVLLNLYVNAWQAMPSGGNLYLETSNQALEETAVHPHDVPPGRYVRVSVTDTGVGMDAQTQARIFEPFFTTKEMGRGTGLGLATVYGIIKSHRGFITVYSEPGEGSTFNVYLPASDRAVPAEQQLLGELPRGSETILLVDDEALVVSVTARMLGRLGYEVVVASSGAEALEIYEHRREQIKLVILDMVMPGMSGSEVFDRLRAKSPDLRVLLSSGYSRNGQAQAILERGCVGFVQKPFNLRELALKVREALERPGNCACSRPSGAPR